MHIPVLLNESIELLDPKEGEFFIDGTTGGGGHSLEILNKIGKSGKLLALDWDKNQFERLKDTFKDFSNVILKNDNYRNLTEILKKENLEKADGLILDLGFSSNQLEQSGRGFSFLKNEPLDMRYKEDREILTAAEIVNTFSEKELSSIFYEYGEERYSRQIAKKIVEERKKKRILMTFDLVEIAKKTVPKNYERGRINPATRIFQALRIYVNQELENLEKILSDLNILIKPGGRVAIISFHSLEDRIVKNFFRNMARDGKAEIVNKKPIMPNEEEVLKNPKSRSAKLRAIKIVRL